jgi:hypothetical protein
MRQSVSTKLGFVFVLTVLSIAVFCVLAAIPISIGRWWLARKRTHNVEPASAVMVAANSLPVPAEAFNKDSVLYLSWSVDYNSSLKLNWRLLSFHRNVWIGASVAALVVLGLSFLLYPHPPLPILVRLIAMLLGVAMNLLVLFVQVTGNLRKTFGPLIPIQSYGLVINPDQLVFLIGDNRFNFPWEVIGRTWESAGIVAYERGKDTDLIPNYAFRSRDDAKAFLATVNALKMGLPPPEHDWSAYVPSEHAVDGVWPPSLA